MNTSIVCAKTNNHSPAEVRANKEAGKMKLTKQEKKTFEDLKKQGAYDGEKDPLMAFKKDLKSITKEGEKMPHDHKTDNQSIGDISEELEERIGEKLAAVLLLRPLTTYNPVRYDTLWGNKTALGIYRTVNRIMEEQARSNSRQA
jgi:hypothetical protein